MGGGCSKYAIPVAVEVVDVSPRDEWGVAHARLRTSDGQVHELKKSVPTTMRPGQRAVVFATADDGVPFATWGWRAPSGRIRVDTGDCRSMDAAWRTGQVAAVVGAIAVVVAVRRNQMGVLAAAGTCAVGCAVLCALMCVLRSLLARFVFDEAVTSDMISSDPAYAMARSKADSFFEDSRNARPP